MGVVGEGAEAVIARAGVNVQDEEGSAGRVVYARVLRS